MEYISNEQIDELVATICYFASDISSFCEEYNYTDYFSPFALSNFVGGETLVTHYLATKAGKYSVKPYAKNKHKESQWLDTKEAIQDDELCGVKILNCCAIKKLTSNVKIFGHNQHEIKINGATLNNHLVLAVPTDRTPENIDFAMIMFRQALKEAFVDVNGCYANISTPSFDSSLFMTSYEDRSLFKEEIKQCRSKIQGLWAWDLVHGCNAKHYGEKMTIDNMCTNILLEEDAIKAKLGYSEPSYVYESNRNYYNQAVKLIGSTSLNKQTNLDKYVTRASVILGKRNKYVG